jgi:Fibronectin type III domain
MNDASAARRGAGAPATVTAAIATMVFLSILVAPVPVVAAPGEQTSPNNELVVVTVNTKQNTTDNARLFELANALRNRPVASSGDYFAPDVIIAQEINNDVSLSVFRDNLNNLFAANYEVKGSTDPSVKAKFLVNTTTMTFDSASTWSDVCDATAKYQLVRLRETATNKSVTVAGAHFRVGYANEDCRKRNADETRRQLDGASRSIVGDFNQRAMNKDLECDPFETSGDKPWYSAMTSTSSIDGIYYIDAVRAHNRANNQSLAHEWTHEQKSISTLCDGSDNYKRSRIDYLFVSNNVGVKEAHADHPGWANEAERGTIACTPSPACKYSDHRFVWGRFDLGSLQSTPEAPANLQASAVSSTQIDLTWTAVPNATGYSIERSNDGATGWSQIATTGSPGYSDTTVIENSTRFYRVFASNSGGKSPPSNVPSATTPATPPTQPNNLTAMGGKRKVTLTWTASTDAGGSGLAGYEIWRSTTGAAGSFTKVATTTSTSYTNSGLVSGRTYWYYAVAYDGANNVSTPSNTVSAKTL